MKPDLVTIERRGPVGLMLFNNPEELNTLHLPMLLAMEEALTLLERDAEVRAIVVTGVDDRAFIAGGNIKDLNSRQGLQHYNEFSEACTGFSGASRCATSPRLQPSTAGRWVVAWSSC